jgi:tripartite-type tricarboxylate transporter receptor subunit TctC
MKSFVLALASCAALLSTAAPALAAYPDRPITIVVPFAAGGPTDKVARDLGVALRKALNNQPVAIENVGGAGGTLGAAKVAKAAPDGYTFLLHHIGMATSPALYRKMAYSTLDDFEYVGMVNDVPMTLIGRPNLPAANMAELRKWIETNKGKINLANAGLGAASHLCGLLLQQALGVDMTTVPYKGTAPAMTDLLGGQVDLLCDQTTNTTPQIRSGKVKAYAVTTMQRLRTPALAGLPTLDEVGLHGFNVTIWHGLYAPKGTPEALLDTMNGALRQALADPDFIKRQEALGAVVIADQRLGRAEHKRFVEAEINKWGPVIRAAGQYAD